MGLTYAWRMSDVGLTYASWLCRRRVTLDFRPTFERGCPEEWINLAKSCWALRPEERPDFDRVVKMMKMIIATIRDKINTEGVITESH